MAANVEAETLVFLRASNAADIGRIGFQDRDRHVVFRQEIGRGQPGRAGPDDGDGLGQGIASTHEHSLVL